MNQRSNNLLIRFSRKVLVLTLLFSVAQYVFAVDGRMNGGGSKSKSKTTFSTIKNDLNLSLKYGYSYNGNKLFDVKKANNFVFSNSILTYRKGNVTYILPYKNKVILQKFKTPTAPIR